MEILKNSNNLKVVIDTEQNFRTDLGWQDNLAEFEKEVLEDIINPAKNYETVRYIHKPYTSSGITQTDIWFQFYFIDGSNYVLDYNPVGITTRENELMLKQSTESFFRLELYKTPGKVSNTGTTLTCEEPTRQNRRLVNSKNLSLPLGEKYFYTTTNSGYYIHIPVFTGSNYRNKENMYLFWFDDESVLTDMNLSGTTTLDLYTFNNTGTTSTSILFTNEINQITQVLLPTGTTQLIGWTGQTFTTSNVNVTYNKRSDGSPVHHGMNTFFMSAKFFNAKTAELIDFTNQPFPSSHVISEVGDMYYQIDFDNYERTYSIYPYNISGKGTKRIGVNTGTTLTSISFFEKGGGVVVGATPTPTPTSTGVPTPTPTPTPTGTSGCVANYTNATGIIWTCSNGTTTQHTVYRNTNSCWTGDQYYSNINGGTTYSTEPNYNSEPSTAQDWQPNGEPYCGDMNNMYLITPEKNMNPCSVNYLGVRDRVSTEPSSTCAENYTMISCSDDNGSTSYSITYPKDSFSINQRVVDGNGIFYYITGTALPTSGGYTITAVPGQTGCPQVYTIVRGCTDEQYYSVPGTHYYTDRITIDSVLDVGGTQCALVQLNGQELTPSHPTAGMVSTDFCECV